MLDKRTGGFILIAVGIVVLILSLLADPLGLGGNNSTFGPYQIAGTIGGAIAAIVGWVLMRRE